MDDWARTECDRLGVAQGRATLLDGAAAHETLDRTTLALQDRLHPWALVLLLRAVRSLAAAGCDYAAIEAAVSAAACAFGAEESEKHDALCAAISELACALPDVLRAAWRGTESAGAFASVVHLVHAAAGIADGKSPEEQPRTWAAAGQAHAGVAVRTLHLLQLAAACCARPAEDADTAALVSAGRDDDAASLLDVPARSGPGAVRHAAVRDAGVRLMESFVARVNAAASSISDATPRPPSVALAGVYLVGQCARSRPSLLPWAVPLLIAAYEGVRSARPGGGWTASQRGFVLRALERQLAGLMELPAAERFYALLTECLSGATAKAQDEEAEQEAPARPQAAPETREPAFNASRFPPHIAVEVVVRTLVALDVAAVAPALEAWRPTPGGAKPAPDATADPRLQRDASEAPAQPAAPEEDAYELYPLSLAGDALADSQRMALKAALAAASGTDKARQRLLVRAALLADALSAGDAGSALVLDYCFGDLSARAGLLLYWLRLLWLRRYVASQEHSTDVSGDETIAAVKADPAFNDGMESVTVKTEENEAVPEDPRARAGAKRGASELDAEPDAKRGAHGVDDGPDEKGGAGNLDAKQDAKQTHTALVYDEAYGRVLGRLAGMAEEGVAQWERSALRVFSEAPELVGDAHEGVLGNALALVSARVAARETVEALARNRPAVRLSLLHGVLLPAAVGRSEDGGDDGRRKAAVYAVADTFALLGDPSVDAAIETAVNAQLSSPVSADDPGASVDLALRLAMRRPEPYVPRIVGLLGACAPAVLDYVLVQAGALAPVVQDVATLLRVLATCVCVTCATAEDAAAALDAPGVRLVRRVVEATAKAATLSEDAAGVVLEEIRCGRWPAVLLDSVIGTTSREALLGDLARDSAFLGSARETPAASKKEGSRAQKKEESRRRRGGRGRRASADASADELSRAEGAQPEAASPPVDPSGAIVVRYIAQVEPAAEKPAVVAAYMRVAEKVGPADFLVLLHALEAAVPLRRLLAVVQLCLAAPAVFRPEVVAAALRALVERRPAAALPALAMRTMLEALRLHRAALSAFCVGLLRTLADDAHRVWTAAASWQGWLRCVRVLQPASLPLLDALPSAVQADLRRTEPDLFSAR